MKDVGGIVKTDINGDPAKLHSECDENGCGEKYDVDGSGRIVELEADEAVIVPEAFEDKCFNDSFCKKPNYYEITGTIKQIASAINVLGGGINFAKGAKVKKNGRKMNVPRLTGQNKTNSISSRIIDSGSVVINRTNMNNPKVMTFKGTLYEIASDINSFGGNGVKLIETNNDNPKKKEGGKITSLSELDNEFLAFLFDLSKTCQRLGLVYDPNPANFGRTTESGDWVLYDIENWIPTQPEFDSISQMPIDEKFVDPKYDPNYEFISTGQGSGGVVYRNKKSGNVLKITNSAWEVWGSKLILEEQKNWRGRVDGFGMVYSVKNLGVRDIEDVFYSSPRNQWYAIEREWVYVDEEETARIGNIVDDIFNYYRENPDKQQKWNSWTDEKQKSLYESIKNTKSGIISFQNPYYPFVNIGLKKEGGKIHPEDSSSFKEWFGSSRVVFQDGSPMPVYHGSNQSGITYFDPEISGSVQYSDWGAGIYFTPSEFDARYYSGEALKKIDPEYNRLYDIWQKSKDSSDLTNWQKYASALTFPKEAIIYKAYLKIEKPFIYRASYSTIPDPTMSKTAREGGYDGIIILDQDGSIDEIVVFSSDQIKIIAEQFNEGGIITYRDKYNKKYGYDDNASHDLHEISKDTGVSIEGLQQIYNKGIGAFKTNPESVRPNVKSKEQWAMARVYSAVMGGKASEIDSNELKKEKGGSIKIDKNKIYKEWSELVNMSKSELEKFYNSEEGKKAGLKPSEAKKQGIDYGRESARWILKMKDTPKTKWSNDMWKWAKKQISFIKRMSGVEGDLYNDKGEKTRKYLALLIWGNDPEKYAKGGSLVGDKQNRPFKVRFHLGRGKNFMHWKIEEKNKPDIFEDPEEVQLIMYNCKLTNQPTTAQKIYSGKINKAPIAYIQCEEVAILPTDVEDIEESNQLRYNPRVNPYWTDTDNDNVDNYYFDKIVSKGSKVYFEEDGQLFYLGGLVEELNTSSELEKEKRYIWEMDGYLWAKNDEEARKIATEIQSNLDFDLRPKINHLYQDFGRGMTRKLFEDGGSISATDKIDLEDLELRIQKLRSSTENFKHKAGEILLMDSLTPEQRLEQRFELIDWIKDDKNDVKIIIAFSGGKDSVAMVLHMIYELNIPKEKIQLWHHEVDGRGNDLFDWKCTTSYCKAFAKALDLPILFSYRDGGIERYIFRTNEPKPYVYFQKEEGGEFFQAPRNENKLNTIKAFPAVGNSLDTRWCSAIAKIEVMLQSINNIDEFKDANLVICTGERRLESANRANYLEIDRYKSMTHTRQSIQWRPVIDFSEKTIWDLFKQYKIQPHPAYEIGFGRCSCQLCIFNSADIWKLNDEISPEKVQRIAEIEKEKGFTLYNEEFKEEKWIPAHSKMTKSGQMRSYKGRFKMVGTGKKKDIYESKVNVGKSPIDIKKEEFRYWIKQATGEFTAPIIVKEWKQPKGAFSSENCGAS